MEKGDRVCHGRKGSTFLSEETASAKALNWEQALTLPETGKLVDVTVSTDNS